MTSHQASAALVLVTILSGLGWLLSKIVLEEMQPFAFMSLRFLLAGLALLLVCGRALLDQSLVNLGSAVLTGLVFSSGMLLWVSGLNISPHMGEAAFISSLCYILIPIIGALVFGFHITKGIVVSLLIALVGLALLSLDEGIKLEKGQLLILISTLAFAMHFLLVARYARRMDPLQLTCVQLLTAGSVASGAGVVTGTMNFSISPLVWLWLLLAAFLATSFRFLLQTHALKYASTNEAGLIMVLEPVCAALLGMWILGETMAANQWWGCSLIFSAVVLRQIAGMQWMKRYQS